MSAIRILTSATAIAGAMLLGGCGEERQAPPPTANSSAPITTPDVDNSPSWVLDPTDGGKVHYNGARAKTSKTVEVGALIRVPQGWDLLEVEIVALSDQRRGAPEARALYRETEESAVRREREAEARRLTNQAMQHPLKRPDKKQRRDIRRFKSGGAD